VLWVVGTSSGKRVEKLELRNFASLENSKYVVDRNPEALEPRSVECMEV
jgi:hypothetical protein